MLQWVDVTLTNASDDLPATVTQTTPPKDQTTRLIAYDFGFDFGPDIDIDSVKICGIKVDIRRRRLGSLVLDDEIKLCLLKIEGGVVQHAETVYSDNEASSDAWPTTYAYKTYGGPHNTWGFGDIRHNNAGLANAIQTADFGVAIAPILGPSVSVGYVDHVQCTVWWEEFIFTSLGPSTVTRYSRSRSRNIRARVLD